MLASWASETMFERGALEQSVAAVNINDQMPLYTLQVLKDCFGGDLSGSRVLFLGVSYLNDVGDTRFTPAGLLYDQLIELDAEVALHDPYLSEWAEKELVIERELIHAFFDAVVVTVSHAQFVSEKYVRYLNSIRPKLILDTLGCYIGQEHKFLDEIVLRTIGKSR